MTFRSVFLGLLGAALISSVCYFNDGIIRQGALVSHLMPVVVYGGLVLFLLILNPLLRRLRASWFSHTTVNAPCVSAFFIALVVCLGMGACRLRFARWPFHPVVFVFLGGWQAKFMAGSFMLGWVIKTLVSKYGGARLYQRLKPLMIGVIAGDMLARLIPMLVGAVYYTATGQSP